jgi:hypothetical protein
MAHHKRKRPKTYDFPTCPYCMFKGPDGPSKGTGNHLTRQRNGLGRRPYRDWKQAQWWDEKGQLI